MESSFNYKDTFGKPNRLYGKFLIGGQFLAFFKSEKTTEIPISYIKLLDIDSVEDGFNQTPSDFYIEYVLPGSKNF